MFKQSAERIVKVSTQSGVKQERKSIGKNRQTSRGFLLLRHGRETAAGMGCWQLTLLTDPLVRFSHFVKLKKAYCCGG